MTKIKGLLYSSLQKYYKMIDNFKEEEYTKNWLTVMERNLDYNEIQMIGEYQQGSKSSVSPLPA